MTANPGWRPRKTIWSLHKIGVIIEFELKATFSSVGATIGQVFVEPVGYLTLLVAGLSGLSRMVATSNGTSINYLSFAFPGVLAVQVIRSFTRAMYRITVDRRWGIQAIKIINGTGIVSYILGVTIVPIAIFCIQTIVLTPIALTLGARITLLGVVSAMVCGMIAILFWTSLTIIITTAMRNYRQRDFVINLALLPLTFSAPILYPLQAAPTYLKIISAMNPLSYQVVAMRELFAHGAFTPALAVSLVLAGVGFLTSVYVLKKAELLTSDH